jgi:predicted acetyltransferase
MSNVQTRPFVFENDLAHVKRMWREVGWVEDLHGENQLDYFFSVGDTMVGTIDDVAECSVHITPGSMRLLNTDLPLCAVTAVITSHIARGHRFAQRLTAAQLQKGASGGAAVAVLGMFDQGFYDKLGFGIGSYDHQFAFDPASLNVSTAPRTPTRLDHDHYAEMHKVMIQRPLHHGSVVLYPEELFRAEVGFESKAFGFGYYDDDVLTHFIWLEADGERGPYEVRWVGYQTSDQLLELLALLKSLADQVYSVKMVEPAEVQLQSLLQRPFRERARTKAGKHKGYHRSHAWWQLRILDVESCVSALEWSGREATAFVLSVTDPVTEHLAEELVEGAWQGISGDYVIEMGQTCTSHYGPAEDLHRLTCSVNALSRLFWGVASASSLAVTDGLQAPDELLKTLDAGLKLPTPHVGWEF